MVGDPSKPASAVGPASPVSEGTTSVRRVLLGEMLVESKVITKEQLAEVLATPRDPGKKLGQVLLEKGWVTEPQLTQTLSLQLSVPWVSLYHIDFSRQLLNRVSHELAEQYCLIPIFVRHVRGQGETLYVAMDDPTNEAAVAEVSRQANLPAKPMIASQSDIRSAIRVYYGDLLPSAPNLEVTAPLTRMEPAVTIREPKAPPPPPPVKQKTERMAPYIDPPAGAPQVPPPAPSGPSLPEARSHSAPPPPPLPAKKTPGATLQGIEEPAPMTTRSSEPPADKPAPESTRIQAAPVAEKKSEPEIPLPRRVIPRSDDGEPKKKGPKMVALTLLDGTTITLPAKKKKEGTGEALTALTARDIVSALRATAHGADASEILGDQVRWEPIVAALLSILLRKGLIADWEFVEELRKF